MWETKQQLMVVNYFWDYCTQQRNIKCTYDIDFLFIGFSLLTLLFNTHKLIFFIKKITLPTRLTKNRLWKYLKELRDGLASDTFN